MTGTVLLMALALGESAAAPTPQEPAPHWRGRVVVLVPPIEDDVMRNALARVSGELAAAPFKTITVPIDPDGDIMAQIESAGNDRAATAAFAIVRDRDAGSGRVTVWVSNRVSGITTVERMHIEGGNVDRGAARLAVETVEFVRASLAELWPSPPPTPRPAPEIVEPPSRGTPPARFALLVGYGLLSDLGGAPDFWSPDITASYVRPGGWGVRVAASGFVSAADVSTDMGSARIRRGMLTAGVLRMFRADHRVQPLLGLGVGAQRVSAEGRAAAAMQGTYDRSAVTGLLTASAGVAIALGAHFAAVAQADLLLSWSDVSIRVAGSDVATFDRPSLFTHVGLLATF
jgi:hypothetical protein